MIARGDPAAVAIQMRLEFSSAGFHFLEFPADRQGFPSRRRGLGRFAGLPGNNDRKRSDLLLAIDRDICRAIEGEGILAYSPTSGCIDVVLQGRRGHVPVISRREWKIALHRCDRVCA